MVRVENLNFLFEKMVGNEFFQLDIIKGNIQLQYKKVLNEKNLKKFQQQEGERLSHRGPCKARGIFEVDFLKNS